MEIPAPVHDSAETGGGQFRDGVGRIILLEPACELVDQESEDDVVMLALNRKGVHLVHQVLGSCDQVLDGPGVVAGARDGMGVVRVVVHGVVHDGHLVIVESRPDGEMGVLEETEPLVKPDSVFAKHPGAVDGAGIGHEKPGLVLLDAVIEVEDLPLVGDALDRVVVLQRTFGHVGIARNGGLVQFLQEIRGDEIVTVHEGDVLPKRGIQGGVARRGRASVIGKGDHLEPAVSSRSSVQDGRGAVRGVVIDTDHLQVRQGLAGQALQAFVQEGLGIEDGNDD